MVQPIEKIDFGPFVFGGNVIGWTLPESEAGDLLDSFLTQGGRAIDTADSYTEWAPGGAFGRSEEILGEWLQSRANRERVVLGTKVGRAERHPRLDRDTILLALEGSLKRLRTDRIDIYYAHRDDPETDLLETLQTLDQLVREGVVGRLGYSAIAPDRLAEVRRLTEAHGLTPISVFQHGYSIVDHVKLDTDFAEIVGDPSVDVLGFHALAAGFLSGKYIDPTVTTQRTARIRHLLDDARAPDFQQRLNALGQKHGVSPAAIALAWFRTRPAPIIPVASARTPAQLDALFAAAAITLDRDDLAQLEW